MQALKILQITLRIPFPLNDGGNIAMWYNLRSLHQNGHHTFLAALNTNKHHQDPNIVSDVAEVYATDINTDINPVKVLRNLFSPIPYVVSRFYSKDFALLLKELCAKEDFDIIQMEGVYLAPYIDTIRSVSQSPILLRAHNIEHEIWKRLSKESENKLKKLIFNQIFNQLSLFEKEQATRFDGIICISKKDEQFFEKYAPTIPKTSISAGIDFEHYPISSIESKPNTLCMLGSMEWQPNVEGLFWFLEEVWSGVFTEETELELHVAGKNPPQRVLDINKPNVVIHGMVPDAQDFLLSYEVLIVPLFSGSGMRLKIVEAMALGKCIISTSIGAEGIPYIDGENILIADSPKEMQDMILKVAANPELRKKIQGNAGKLAETHFDWRQLVKRFENFYLKFL